MTSEGIQRTKSVTSGSEIHPHYAVENQNILECRNDLSIYFCVLLPVPYTTLGYHHKTESCSFLRGIICSNCSVLDLKLQYSPCKIITVLHCHRLRTVSSGVKKAEGTEVNAWMKNLYADTFS